MSKVIVHGSYTDNIGDDVIHRGLEYGLKYLGFADVQYVNGRFWNYDALNEADVLFLTGGQLMDWEGEAGHFPLDLLKKKSDKIFTIGWDFGWNRELNQNWSPQTMQQFEQFLDCMSWIGMRTDGDYEFSKHLNNVYYFPFPSLLPTVSQAKFADVLLISLSNHTPYSSERFTKQFIDKTIQSLRQYQLKWFDASDCYEGVSDLQKTTTFDNARLLITNRTHLTVEAVRYGIPVLLIPYNIKSYWAASTLSLPYVHTCESIVRWVNKNWEKIFSIRDQVVKRREKLKKITMKNLEMLKRATSKLY